MVSIANQPKNKPATWRVSSLRGECMAQIDDPTIWERVFIDTPPVLRWVLGILTLGLGTLAGIIYRRERESIRHMHRRMDRMEEYTAEQFESLRKDFNEGMRQMNSHLISIARNTQRGDP